MADELSNNNDALKRAMAYIAQQHAEANQTPEADSADLIASDAKASPEVMGPDASLAQPNPLTLLKDSQYEEAGEDAPAASRSLASSPDESGEEQSDSPEAPKANAAPKQSGIQQMLQEAIQRRNDQQLMSGLAQAGAQIGHGISRSNAPLDESLFNNLNKNAEQGISDVLTKNKLTSDEQAQQKLEMELKSAKQAHDATSSASKIAQDSYKNILNGMGKPIPANIGTFTAADLEPFLGKGSLEAQYKIYSINETRKEMAASRADAAHEKSSQKKEQDQNKTFSELSGKVENFRGNKMVGQAASDVYSAEKALALVKNKDPNSLTTQDLHILSTELAKISLGGVPGEHGVEALMPNNIKTRLAGIENFLSSKPTDAQAGEYIRKNMNYLQDMTDVAHAKLNEYRSNIVSGYKDRIRPDQLKDINERYNLGSKMNRSPSSSVSSSQQNALAMFKKKYPNVPDEEAIQALKDGGKW